MKKILLPVDGSETCYKSFEHAKKIGEKFNAEITILHVRLESAFPYDDGQMMYDISYYLEKFEEFDKTFEHNNVSQMQNKLADHISQEILDKAKEYFENTNLKVNTKFIKGKPANTIIEVAEANDFDLVIMCTHGMSVVQRFTLGSVTNKVVHHCKVPVMIIR